MNLSYKLLLCAGICLIFPSCTVTYGNKDIVDEGKVGFLKPKEVNIYDVYARLGQPSEVVKSSAKESLWIYRYRAAKDDVLAYMPMGGGLLFGGKNGDVHQRDFYFDSSDRLTKVEQNNKKLYTSNLFSLGRTIGGAFRSNDELSESVRSEMKRIGKEFDKSKYSEDLLLKKAL